MQSLISAHADPKRYHSIESTTRSIIFLATPHGGRKTANFGSLLSHVASLAFQSPSKQLLETLKHKFDILSRLSEEFRQIYSEFDIVNFYERRKNPGLNSLVRLQYIHLPRIRELTMHLKIVDETSSKLGLESELLIPIDATHSGICKFHSRTDPLFLLLLAQIKRCSNQSTQDKDKSGKKLQCQRLLLFTKYNRDTVYVHNRDRPFYGTSVPQPPIYRAHRTIANPRRPS